MVRTPERSDGRAGVLDAVVQLLLDEGFEGISVRKVATRAGVSIGTVQHHFPTKDAMLAAAMASVSTAVADDIRSVMVATTDPRERLRRTCLALTGLRPEQRPASILWIARLARAEVHPATAATHAEEWAGIEQLLTGLLAAAVPGTTVARYEAEAGALLALLDGLAVAVAREPHRMPAGRAQRLVEDHLARVPGLLGQGDAGEG